MPCLGVCALPSPLDDAITTTKSTGTIQSAVLDLIARQSSVDSAWQLVSTGSGLSGAEFRITLNGWTGTPKFKINSAGAVTIPGMLALNGASSMLGYGVGAGADAAVSRTTGGTNSHGCGTLTLASGAGSTTPASITITNTLVAATDVIVLSQKSGTDKYQLHCTAVGAGSWQLTFWTISGTTTEQPVFNFAVIKGVAA